MYHWQLDLWNRSKVNITIHNSAKVAIVLEESKFLLSGITLKVLLIFEHPDRVYMGCLWFVCAVSFNVHIWHAQTINFP